ncbi:GNAT family N-acetyltransferase [Niabella drilacis]|uniref:N-acetylglutamate synthase, GNAT family n=1 Tax=Niabella drilacis (strain DSM 25811 / CCM 8410 / CCUG 62505 / LMG 26954 / E90) TaxID=1285928 RepID=A0A1G6ITJ2_NIADE|nr:GNAT family N-acetyltransferase [Niabella drilacis]SDC09753.1 N-acetylglutamate synthase, GNAT family [Niabella drilacis]
MMQQEDTYIRKATAEDAAAIHQLALDIWPKAFEQLLSQEQTSYMMQMMYAPSVLEQEMERGVEYYILNHKGVDMGYTAIEQKAPGSWKLHKIYLSQQLHGKGLGKYQLKSMEAVAKGYGARQLLLNVNRRNKAVDFYKSQGYEIVKTEDIDIGNGYFMNDYVMQKELG